MVNDKSDQKYIKNGTHETLKHLPCYMISHRQAINKSVLFYLGVSLHIGTEFADFDNVMVGLYYVL